MMCEARQEEEFVVKNNRQCENVAKEECFTVYDNECTVSHRQCNGIKHRL